jgi:uncharacterized protein
VIVPSSGNPSEMIVFNLLSGAAVTLPTRVTLQSLRSEQTLDLMRLNIVTLDDDEKHLVDYWTRRNRHGHLSTSVIVFTTRSCNLRCTYCYQREEPSSISEANMEPEICRGFLDWLTTYLLAKKTSSVHLTFYGGEPLLNMECVNQVGEYMVRFCGSRNIKLYTYLVTNGTLVNEQIMLKLLDYNLCQAQVTIDGSEQVHDSRRISKDGSGSYTDTLRGLMHLSHRVPVVVRCNVELSTLEAVDDLLARLGSLGLANERTIFSVADTCRWVPEDSRLVGSMTPQELARLILETSRKARMLGFGIRNPFKLSSCFGTREGSFAVDIDGYLYTCSQMAGFPELSIGSVNSRYFTEVYYRLVTSDALRQMCFTCTYLPLCMGGCRAEALHAGLGFNGNICRRDYYEHVIPQMVRLVYGFDHTA